MYPVISSNTPIFLTNPKTTRIHESCTKLRSISRSSQHQKIQNPIENDIKPKTQFINPVLMTNTKSHYGFQAMLSLCGLGYWVQGFRCFPWLALNFHMAHNLNFNPSTLQLVQNSANFPMLAKPLYGILSDAFCIAGSHRIPYICIGGQFYICCF